MVGDAERDSVRLDRVAAIARPLMEDAKKLSDDLFRLYEQGRGDRWPLPLLSGLKSGVAALDRVSDLGLLEPELVRVKREVAQLASFCRAFQLRPQSSSR